MQLSAQSSNRANSSLSAKSFGSSWKKYAETIILDDASVTSSLNANINFAFNEGLDNTYKCIVLEGFHPNNLFLPFDPEHVGNVFLKCRIALNDYIKTLENDQKKNLNFTKIIKNDSNLKKNQTDDQVPKKTGSCRGRGLLSSSINNPRDFKSNLTLDTIEPLQPNKIQEFTNIETNCKTQTLISVEEEKITKTVEKINVTNTKNQSVKNEQSTLNLNYHNEQTLPERTIKKDSHQNKSLPQPDLSLFETKYNFKYKDIYYRLNIQNDKRVSDLKRKISYIIKLGVELIGLSFVNDKPDLEITDQMTIVMFNESYKQAFYVFDLTEFVQPKYLFNEYEQQIKTFRNQMYEDKNKKLVPQTEIHSNEESSSKKFETGENKPQVTTMNTSNQHNEMTLQKEEARITINQSEYEALLKEKQQLENEVNMLKLGYYSSDNRSMNSYNTSYFSYSSTYRKSGK